MVTAKIAEHLVQHPIDYLEELCSIPAKDRESVPFRLWPVQRRLAEEFCGRDIVIKDSQCGSTSIFSGLFLVDTITHPNTTTVIMAHDEFTTKRLMRRINVVYESIPPKFKPKRDHKSDAEIRFPDLNSVIFISSARAAVAGRGEPIHNLLLSEAAHYQPGTDSRIILPALQRVPEEGRVIIESTPNGEDEIFYPQVQASLEGSGIYKLHTVYWWENSDNWMEADSRLNLLPAEREMAKLTTEEDILQLEFRVTIEQLRWRRYKTREMQGNSGLFDQEHLEDLSRCFLSTGLPYYPPELLLQLSAKAYEAPHEGQHDAKVWFPPEHDGVYVMGVDPGQGKITESAVTVFRIYPNRGPQHCATLSGIIDPLEFYRPVIDLAEWYNKAFIIPEANSHGIGLVIQLLDYPNMYWREDIVAGKTKMVRGWLTTPRTKPFMMQMLNRFLMNMETYDAKFLRQCRGFKHRVDGRVIATGLDDVHDAAALAAISTTSVDSLRAPSKTGLVAHTPTWPI